MVTWSLLPTGFWALHVITTVNKNELQTAESKTPEVDLYQRFRGFSFIRDSQFNESN